VIIEVLQKITERFGHEHGLQQLFYDHNDTSNRDFSHSEPRNHDQTFSNVDNMLTEKDIVFHGLLSIRTFTSVISKTFYSSFIALDHVVFSNFNL
jgi:hypothetical protein